MNIQKAINVIDKVSIIITEKVSNSYIAESLENKMKPELFRDLMDRWYRCRRKKCWNNGFFGIAGTTCGSEYKIGRAHV